MQLHNNLKPTQFLAEYWQKKPLLIRQAIPNFKSFLSAAELVSLAIEDEAEARLITNKNGQWKVKSNPLDERDFSKLPQVTTGKLKWTVLVQNIQHYLPQAADLLAQFNFIPHARLDDLMISYAPKGSGIGAHVDSYDVFLLQGAGKRKWQISSQTDLSLVEGAPLKILQNFVPEQEWILEAGDMLYLPPHIAHCGTSESDDCMTYSIGFRAPNYAELAHEFLYYLQDKLPQNTKLKGMYTDPDLTMSNHAGEISTALRTNIHKALQGITWNSNDIGDFLGHYLTEPKAHVYFDAPADISQATFSKKLATKTLWLSLKSQLLFTNDNFYLNGEPLNVPAEIVEVMKHFADKKYIETAALEAIIHAACSDALYDAYLAGYVCFKR
jgi:50S ribosomal protein L16 3-hydroxylase